MSADAAVRLRPPICRFVWASIRLQLTRSCDPDCCRLPSRIRSTPNSRRASSSVLIPCASISRVETSCSRSPLLTSANCAVSVSAKPLPSAFVASSWPRERNGRTARIRAAVGLEWLWLLHSTPTSPAKIAKPILAATTISGRLDRSEEHTSELQSPDHLVCRLLLEKKKQKQTQ